MGKRKDRSIQLTHVRVRESGRKNNRSHPAALRVLRWLFFLSGSFSLNLWFVTLFHLSVPAAFLAVSTLVLGGWYFLTFFSGKTCRICVPVTIGIILFFLVRMWDDFYRGFGQIINTASQYIMDYYYTNLGFVPVEADDRAVLVAVLLTEALFMFWLGSSILSRGSSGSLLVLALVLLCMGLTVNRFPSPWAVLLWTFSFFAVRSVRTPFKMDRVRISPAGVGIGVAVFAAAMVLLSWYVISPRLDDVMIARYPDLREFQDNLEEKTRELIGGRGSGSWQGMVQNGVLTNSAPSGEDETALTITVDRQPEHNIYLKGFVGDTYQGSYWEEISEKNFQNALEDPFSGMDVSYNEDRDWTEISYADMQQYLTDGFYVNEGIDSDQEPMKFTLDYEDTPDDFVYTPYLASVEGENVEYYADVELRRTNDDAVSGNFYLELPELSANTGYSNMIDHITEASMYAVYINRQYLLVPSEGMTELKTYWSDRLEEYAGATGHYPSLTETTTLIRQVLSECTYSLELESVPEGEDFIEYFLFQQKKGFCTHFASTAVMLYRLAGYPARYATGYITRPDEFEEDENGGYTAQVPGENAHAWVEIYQNPTIGWIPVEMTPGYQDEGTDAVSGDGEETTAVPTPTESADQENSGGETDEGEVQTPVNRLPSVLLRILTAAAAAAAVVLAVVLRRWIVIRMRIRKFQNRDRRKAMTALVREADKMIGASGLDVDRNISDGEYARRVEESFPDMSPGKFRWFVEQGESAAYGNRPVSAGTVAECIRIFGELEKEIRRGHGPVWRFWWRFIKCYR